MPKHMMEACLSQGLFPVSMSTAYGILRKRKKKSLGLPERK